LIPPNPTNIESCRVRTGASTTVSKEWAVLLEACAKRPDRLQLQQACSALQGAGWTRLLGLADEHCVMALVHTALSQIGESFAPPAIALEIEKRYSLNVHRSLLQARELLRVLAALDATGVLAIPYKGLVLSELAYGDLAMRQAGDIDLLVRRHDVARAQIAVEKLGYTPCLQLSPEQLKRYLEVGYEMPFDFGNQRNLLELKWGILPHFYAVDFDMDAMFSETNSDTFAETAIHALASEDLFLVLCVHAAKHCWSRLIWLCDLARLGEMNLDWARIADKARKLGITRIVRISVALASQLLHAEIPPHRALDIAGDPLAAEIAVEIANQITTGTSPAPESLAYFRLMMRVRERQMDRMRFACRLAFTPGPNEWNAIQLWGPLSPLYRLVRVARLGSRFARGSTWRP
jgi:Uncharacterised nucleotidyltransferase